MGIEIKFERLELRRVVFFFLLGGNRYFPPPLTQFYSNPLNLTTSVIPGLDSKLGSIYPGSESQEFVTYMTVSLILVNELQKVFNIQSVSVVGKWNKCPGWIMDLKVLCLQLIYLVQSIVNRD